MRIASWNVRGLRDDSRLLTEVLLAERPDVLCLQEAPLGWRVGSPAAPLGGSVRPGRWRRQAANRETALLASPSVEVLAAGDLALPYPRGRPPRAAAWAEVARPGLRVAVMSVHLGLAAVERVEQAAVVRAWTAQGAGSPVVIAGDLNERPTDPAGRVLAGGLQDAGAGEAAPTFPARSPARRIDAVLVDPRLRVVACRTLAGYERATDHCPLIVDLEPLRLRGRVRWRSSRGRAPGPAAP